jgi:hypothetical protein
MKISETPQKWIVLQFPDNLYKVFGSWAGSYLDGDRWKLNSGIRSIILDGDYYLIEGWSGSFYKCHVNAWGIASLWTNGILNTMLEKAKDVNVDIKVITYEEFKELKIS